MTIMQNGLVFILGEVGSPNDIELRAMRDVVFGKPISDREWEHCRENWFNERDIKWLTEQSNKIKNAELSKNHR